MIPFFGPLDHVFFFQPPLLTHLPTLTGGAGGVRVLLPLCGKAGCLLHLYNAGHTVVGHLQSSRKPTKMDDFCVYIPPLQVSETNYLCPDSSAF